MRVELMIACQLMIAGSHISNDTLWGNEMDTFNVAFQHLVGSEVGGADSVSLIIQRGLDFLLHGKNAEGITLLTQAHLQLAAGKLQVVALLEAVINACVRYDQAQQALHNASRDYTRAELERETQLRNLADALAAPDRQVVVSSSPPVSQLISAYQYEQVEYLPSIADTSAQTSRSQGDLPALSITCFGEFVVHRNGTALELCRSRNGQTILRYLVAQPGYRATADALMSILWPDEDPEVARRKLQVAVSSLRCSLNQGYDCDPGGGYFLCKNQSYQINPSVIVRTDVDEFLALYQAGQHASPPEMISSYEQACRLFRGPFLAEDLYATWSMRRREQLSQIYVTMCGTLSRYSLKTGRHEDAARWARAILDENRCDEEAHRQLMRAFAALGRRGDALRQYYYCEQVLSEELSAAPMPETTQVYQSILVGHTSPTLEGE